MAAWCKPESGRHCAGSGCLAKLTVRPDLSSEYPAHPACLPQTLTTPRGVARIRLLSCNEGLLKAFGGSRVPVRAGYSRYSRSDSGVFSSCTMRCTSTRPGGRRS